LATLGPGDFLGEGCIIGNPERMATVMAIAPLNATSIDKKEMLRVPHEETDFDRGDDVLAPPQLPQAVLTSSPNPSGRPFLPCRSAVVEQIRWRPRAG
jgi:CRP-like cAMP-binding protein